MKEKTGSYTDQRNVLVLCVSVDLNEWTIVKTLLADDTGFLPADSDKYTGFHYVDWQFDGTDQEDIIYAVRTAYRGANSFHNSNRITFKVLSDYRHLVGGMLTLTVNGSTMVPKFEPQVLDYFVHVPAHATTVQVTPGAAILSSQFTVDGQVVESGVASSMPFPASAHTITVRVCDHADHTDQTCYVLVCIRTVPPVPSALKLSGSGFSIGAFDDGSPAFLNRGYVWRAVPESLAHKGLRHSTINGGAGTKGAAVADIHVAVIKDCVVYLLRESTWHPTPSVYPCLWVDL